MVRAKKGPLAEEVSYTISGAFVGGGYQTVSTHARGPDADWEARKLLKAKRWERIIITRSDGVIVGRFGRAAPAPHEEWCARRGIVGHEEKP